MYRFQGFHLVAFISLALICYLTLFRGLGDYGLWDPDEGRSGVIVKEMLDSGKWITLTRNGEPYYDKPPLYFWLASLGLKFLGLSELAVRLPSALAASLTVGAVYVWALRAGGWMWGLWAGLVLLTSGEFVALGRFANTDMVFTFFFTAALLCFLLWLRQGQGRTWITLFYILLGLASLTKGPVGALLPLAIVGITLAVTGRWAAVRDLRILWGGALLLLVAGSWYILAAVHDPAYVKTFLWDHNVLRYFTTQRRIAHAEPFYYLILVLVGGFLPWTFFVPPLLAYLWERREEEGREERLLLVVWVAATLVFFSLSRNKLGTYVLPAYPPLALLMGDFLTRMGSWGKDRPWVGRWISYGTLVWLFLLLGLSPLSEIVLASRYPQYLPITPPLLPVVLLILFAVLVWALGKGKSIPLAVVVSALWLVFWFYGYKAAEIAELRGARGLAQMVHANGVQVPRVLAIRSDSFSFYLPYPVLEVPLLASIRAMLEQPIPTVALIKEKHLMEIDGGRPASFFVWKTVPWGNALVANFPPSGAQDLGMSPKR